MAIADAEPKKGDVDVTSTGSSSGSAEAKKLLQGPVKYSSLKDFSFSVSDVWDDKNICIFLECCHANVEGLKSCSGSEENKVWEKIARSGLERSGSINCFNVNDCLELARCLKSFVTKNETKMTDNDIFKALHGNVSVLLPYFAPVDKVIMLRSRSKSIEKGDSVLSTGEGLVLPPLQSHNDSLHALQLVAKVMKKYKMEDFGRTTSRNAIWREVSASIENEFGVSVNPARFLEGYKFSVANSVREQSTPADRVKVFLQLTGDILPYFDLISPRSIKKSEFLPTLPEDCRPNEPFPFTPKSYGRKRKNGVVENVDHPSGKMLKTAGKSSDNTAVDTSNTPAPSKDTTKNKIVECDVPETVPAVPVENKSPDRVSNVTAAAAAEELPVTATANEPSVLPPAVPKRRGRKPKSAAERAQKLVPTRRSSRHQKPDSEAQDSLQAEKNTEVSVPSTEKLPAASVKIPGQVAPTASPQKTVPATTRTKSQSVAQLDSGKSQTISTSERSQTIAEPVTVHPSGPAPDTSPATLATNNSQVVAAPQLRKIQEVTLIDSPEVATADTAQAMTATDTSRSLVPVTSSRELVARTAHPARAICYGGNDQRSDERTEDSSILSDSDDSEILDVPLMGTNIRVHIGKGTVESKSSLGRDKMNPVVLLDKTTAESYLGCSTSAVKVRPVRRARSQWRRRGTTVEEKSPRRRATPTLSSSTGIVRRRPGRPPKNPPHLANPKPTNSGRFLAIEDSTRSNSHHHLARTAPNAVQPYSAGYSSQVATVNRDLSTTPFRDNLIESRPPPTWFTDFVVENRRHEVWKMHQLLKMQTEIMTAEHEKRGVLDKILAALRDRP